MEVILEFANAHDLEVKQPDDKVPEILLAGRFDGSPLLLKFFGFWNMWLYLPNALDLGLHIEPRPLAHPSGDFSAAYLVRSIESARADALCTEQVKRVLRQPRDADVHVTDATVRFDFRNVRPFTRTFLFNRYLLTGSPAEDWTVQTCERWVRQAVEVAGPIDAARAAVPVAAVLEPYVAPLESLARHAECSLSRTPLRLAGHRGGLQLTAAFRLQGDAMILDVNVAFPKPVVELLSVKPRPEGFLPRLLSGSARKLGHQQFDATFDISYETPEGARGALDDAACVRAVELWRAFGDLRIDPRGARVQLLQTELKPDRTAALIEGLLDLAHGIAVNAGVVELPRAGYR